MSDAHAKDIGQVAKEAHAEQHNAGHGNWFSSVVDTVFGVFKGAYELGANLYKGLEGFGAYQPNNAPGKKEKHEEHHAQPAHAGGH